MRIKIIEGDDGRYPNFKMGVQVRLVTGNVHKGKVVKSMKQCAGKDILTAVT